MIFLSQITKQNDIWISGSNFGSGSSREQAATCILAAGIKIVLAASFSETFKRNAVNNGLIVLEAPAVVTMLRGLYKRTLKTRRTSLHADIDLIKGTLKINSSVFNIPTLGTAVFFY